MNPVVTHSVSERALLVLEIIARAEEPPTLNDLVEALQLPKATTHRFVVQLEALRFIVRSLDGRRFEIGPRLALMARDAMQQAFRVGPRRAILSALVAEVRETCNVTMLEGDHIVYLDRVESDWPLQIRLDVGSHVPLHCTASGKLFLSLGSSSLRNAILKTKLQRHTPHTLTSTQKLEAELEKCARSELGIDHEEFIEGMNAVAVPVFDARRRICATVSVHGPAGRLPMKRALGLVPALRSAAKAIESTF